MKTVQITIEGMTCGGCVASVQRVLDRVPGVTAREVSIGSARVTFDEARASEDALRTAIDDAGFDTMAVTPAAP